MFRWPLGLVLAVVLVGCGGNGQDAATDDPVDPGAEELPDDAADDADEATEEAPDAAVLTTATSDLGEILVDGDGVTLYLLDQDSEGESTCYDDCAATWPPLLGPVEAGAGVDAALMGSTERTDGNDQVTYDGHPLYYFAADQVPGDLSGQGVGDVWWVVSPEGDSITEMAAETPSRDY